MGDENKKTETPPEPQPGLLQNKILYVIIACAIVILAIVLIAKFGFNMDLLSPASGEMSIAGHQFTANREFATPTTERQAYNANFTVTPTMTFGVSGPVRATYDTHSGTVALGYFMGKIDNEAQAQSYAINKSKNVTEQVKRAYS
jgi:hypothetical protein